MGGKAGYAAPLITPEPIAPMLRRLLLLLALVGLTAAPAGANPLCPEGGPIRFAHYEFGLLYSADTGTGIDDEIQQELQRRSGCAFTVSLRPRARIWVDLQTGALDMAGSGIQTPARDAFAWFAHYVVEDNQVVLADTVPASVRDMADFLAQPRYRLGNVRSFSFSPYYDDQVAWLQRAGRLHTVSDTAALYRQFAQGRFQAFIASPFLSRHYFQRMGIPVPRRTEDWDPAPPTPSGLVMAKKRFSPAQAQAWQALVQGMLDDGTVLRIVGRYLGPKDAPAALYRPAR